MDTNKLKNITICKTYDEKKNSNLIDINWLERKQQIIFLNELFLNENLSEPHSYIKKELTKKLNSYNQQDKTKNIHENTSNFLYDELIIKLVESKLKCYYCREDIQIIYDKKLQQNQWTLDRINNFQGHTSENTVISCLKCNIKRGRTNNKKFLFTKQLIIKKKE